jgi:hypothetical protein
VKAKVAGREGAARADGGPASQPRGFEIEADEPEAVHIMLGLADGSLGHDEFAAWIRSRVASSGWLTLLLPAVRTTFAQ